MKTKLVLVILPRIKAYLFFNSRFSGLFEIRNSQQLTKLNVKTSPDDDNKLATFNLDTMIYHQMLPQAKTK